MPSFFRFSLLSMMQSNNAIRPRRSLLFVPGLRPDMFAKALNSGADIVCIDMEDAVARSRKDEGRALTLPLFANKTHPHVEQMVRINGLSTVWVNVDIPEAQSAAVVPGAPISATVPAYPGEKFAGRINAVLPDVVAASRTVRARVELGNPGAKLKPGMYVTLAIAPASSREAVLVPTEALIPTGRRTVIVVDRGDSRFEPVEVETGREQGGRTEILKGLDAGARVIVSGQFLIDSEASLKATTTRMGEAAGAKEYQADAKLEKFGKDTWTITHGPVPELKWGAMTMEFLPMKEGVPAGAKPGQAVRLTFTLDKDGMPVVTKIVPKGAAQ